MKLKLYIVLLLFCTSLYAYDLLFTNSNNIVCVDYRYEVNNPKDSARILIDNLNIITNSYIPNRQRKNYTSIMNSIYILMELRRLTGTDFLARTTHTFNTNKYVEEHRKYFLYLYDSNSVPFYAQWMSRCAFYFAPIDAQQKIIEKWKLWYKNNADSSSYNTNNFLEDCHSPFPIYETNSYDLYEYMRR